MNEKTTSKDLFRKAMNAAARLLARRDHTGFEIKQKLRQRGYDRGVIDAVLTECERLNYINDERTARVYIGQLARRGFGFRRIRMELKKKGLSGDYFESILNESSAEIDEGNIAKRALQKKMKSFEREKDNRKRRVKIYRFLYSRGFTETVISEIVRKFN